MERAPKKHAKVHKTKIIVIKNRWPYKMPYFLTKIPYKGRFLDENARFCLKVSGNPGKIRYFLTNI